MFFHYAILTVNEYLIQAQPSLYHTLCLRRAIPLIRNFGIAIPRETNQARYSGDFHIEIIAGANAAFNMMCGGVKFQ